MKSRYGYTVAAPRGGRPRGPALTAGSEGGAVRAGGSGSRGTRRLQSAPGPRPAAPEYECARRSRKRHATAGTRRAGPPARTVRRGGPSDVLLGPNERASTGRGPGLPRGWAAESPADRGPGRDDCGGGVSSGLRNPSSPDSNSNPGPSRPSPCLPAPLSMDSPHLRRRESRTEPQAPTRRATYYEMAVSIRSGFFLDD